MKRKVGKLGNRESPTFIKGKQDRIQYGAQARYCFLFFFQKDVSLLAGCMIREEVRLYIWSHMLRFLIPVFQATGPSLRIPVREILNQVPPPSSFAFQISVSTSQHLKTTLSRFRPSSNKELGWMIGQVGQEGRLGSPFELIMFLEFQLGVRNSGPWYKKNGI